MLMLDCDKMYRRPYRGMIFFGIRLYIIPWHIYNIHKHFIHQIPHAAKEMNEKIKARKKRNNIVSVLKQSNHAALRVFADQLKLVKY